MYESNKIRALAINKQTKTFRYVIPVSVEFKGHQKNIKAVKQPVIYILFYPFVFLLLYLVR